MQEELRRWHESRDREAGRTALAFLEGELRLMVPGLVRRTWPQDLVEDALRSFLVKLLEKPLPAPLDKPRGYVAQAFRNCCIDLHMAWRRRRESSIEDAPAGWEPPADSDESPADVASREEEAQLIRAAIGQLEIADRIALKLDDAPEWLDDEEVRWLSDCGGTSPLEVRRAVASAEDMHALTRVFDLGDDDPQDPQARRKRMERFRRRRARAREKLRELLREVR